MEEDFQNYQRERSMQEWEHFQGSSEEAKVCSLLQFAAPSLQDV